MVNRNNDCPVLFLDRMKSLAQKITRLLLVAQVKARKGEQGVKKNDIRLMCLDLTSEVVQEIPASRVEIRRNQKVIHHDFSRLFWESQS